MRDYITSMKLLRRVEEKPIDTTTDYYCWLILDVDSYE